MLVIPININEDEFKKALDETEFFSTWNNVMKPEYQIVEPTLEEKLNPKKIQIKDKKGKIFKTKSVEAYPLSVGNGFLSVYGTHIHHYLQIQPIVRSIFSMLDNIDEKDLKFWPNQMRLPGIGLKTELKENASSVHSDGESLYTTLKKKKDLNFRLNKPKNNTEMKKFELKKTNDKYILDDSEDKIVLFKGKLTPIINITGKRKFTFWHITDDDSDGITNMFNEGHNTGHAGKKNVDNKVDKNKLNKDLHKYFPNKRKTIVVDCKDKPYIILWYENVWHEIAHSKSFNVFIGTTSEFKHKSLPKLKPTFHNLIPKEFNYFKNNYTWKFEDNKENNSLTQLESNLLGLIFGIAGFQHPGSHLIRFHEGLNDSSHVYSKPNWKIKDLYIEEAKHRDTGEQKDKFRYQLPNIEEDKGIEITDKFLSDIQEYENGWIIPIRVIEELENLKGKKRMKYDIRKWDDIILEDYGFKKREGRLDWNPNWIPEGREGYDADTQMYLDTPNTQSRSLISNQGLGLNPPYYPEYDEEDYDEE